MQSVDATKTEVSPILFTRGVPAVEALPAKLLGECFYNVLSREDGWSVLQYGHNGGYEPLRQLIAGQYGVNDNEVVVGNGSLHLQDLISALLIRPGDVVLTEQPSYDRAIKTFRRRGAKVIGIPLEHDGVNIAALEKAISQKVPAFMYVIPDFQNPAGVTTSAEKRQALVHLAEKYGFWLIEDVPYRTLRYSGKPEPLLREIGTSRVLTISSYSKLISPALRVGYVVGPVDLLEELRKLAEDTILSPVLPTQAVVVEFHQRGYFAANLENLKQLYAPRLQVMIKALKTHLPNVPFAEPEGGFFVSLNLPTSPGPNLLARARQVGLVLTDGRSFFADPLDEETEVGKSFVRLPFCALTPAQIEEGVKRLASIG